MLQNKIPVLRITRADLNGSGEYAASDSIDFDGHIEIGQNLGCVRFRGGIKAGGRISALTGTGIAAAADTIAGAGIMAAGCIDASGRIIAGGKIAAGAGIWAGKSVNAGKSIVAEDGITADGNIIAGNDIKTRVVS